jgi:hypothetical protein
MTVVAGAHGVLADNQTERHLLLLSGHLLPDGPRATDTCQVLRRFHAVDCSDWGPSAV